MSALETRARPAFLWPQTPADASSCREIGSRGRSRLYRGGVGFARSVTNRPSAIALETSALTLGGRGGWLGEVVVGPPVGHWPVPRFTQALFWAWLSQLKIVTKRPNRGRPPWRQHIGFIQRSDCPRREQPGRILRRTRAPGAAARAARAASRTPSAGSSGRPPASASSPTTTTAPSRRSPTPRPRSRGPSTRQRQSSARGAATANQQAILRSIRGRAP